MIVAGQLLHTPGVDISDAGPRLDASWTDLHYNVCGVLHGCSDASAVAACFVRAGWRSRSSSWDGYEVETNWCQVEIDPVDGSDVLLSGVADPRASTSWAGSSLPLGSSTRWS